MNLRLAVASAWLPGFVKRRKLRELLRRCADAFGAPPPDVAWRPYGDTLRTFAEFTAERAESVLGEGDAAAAQLRARLRVVACDLGRELRRTLGVATRADAMKAARLIYRVLGIDFEGRVDGRILIRRCFFSRVYSPGACALVSGLDEGLLVGLAGGGRLEFTARITEGCDHCRATFRFDGAGGAMRLKDGQS